jgi:hypothetical protein
MGAVPQIGSRFSWDESAVQEPFRCFLLVITVGSWGMRHRSGVLGRDDERRKQERYLQGSPHYAAEF